MLDQKDCCHEKPSVSGMVLVIEIMKLDHIPHCLSITARAISYSFRDLSLLDIAYISCDIKE